VGGCAQNNNLELRDKFQGRNILSSAGISVVIPTHNRRAILQKAIEAYDSQTAFRRIREILIVDDGSTDGTAQFVLQHAKRSSLALRYLGQENKGQAAARNLGISEAKGELILLADDDIIPERNMVEEHLLWHEKHPDANFAVMGYVPWSPEVRPTPLMQWAIQAGPQFSYGIMELESRLPFDLCYFNNTSLKAPFLRANGLFDERMRWLGEDWELGYRLYQKGLVMMFHPQAKGYHYKRLTFADLCRHRAGAVGPGKPFYTTEAGRELLEKRAQRTRTMKYRLQAWGLKHLVPLLSPLRLLLDSRIRLPGMIYRAFYVYYAILTPATKER
jgi:glycosyltransferase involved in cell wall biosynthesis